MCLKSGLQTSLEDLKINSNLTMYIILSSKGSLKMEYLKVSLLSMGIETCEWLWSVGFKTGFNMVVVVLGDPQRFFVPQTKYDV